jgi:hypothetical protein
MLLGKICPTLHPLPSANAHFHTKLATRIVHTVIIALLLDAFRGKFFKELVSLNAICFNLIIPCQKIQKTFNKNVHNLLFPI